MTPHTNHRSIPEDAKIDQQGNASLFEVSTETIISTVHDLCRDKNLSLLLVTATDERKNGGGFRIWYVFGAPKEHAFIVPFIRLQETEEFPSIASVIHEAWDFERRIQTFFGLTPAGHLDAQRILLQENWPSGVFPLRKDFIWNMRPDQAQGTRTFHEVGGEGIYEIPVGPIHAGIIEPGHFRFSVAGEEIVLLEPRLGFTHKGSEKLFETLPLQTCLRLSEKISGDSSFSHALAFAQAVEQLADVVVPQRAGYLRVVFAELERLANHCGDIGAIMLDTGFSFGGAHGARLRETFMRINERLTGSRFLRGVNAFGGVTKDIGEHEQEALLADLASIRKDFSEIIDIAENCASLLSRLKGTGVLLHDIALRHGVTGVAGKASGVQADVRRDYATPAYADLYIDDGCLEHGGDVYARFRVRISEVYASLDMIRHALERLPPGAIASDEPIVLKPNALAVSVVEGWRGAIVYFTATDAKGALCRVAVRDPSVMNWTVLGNVGVGNVVPDFPLINKSFNLSYSGNDL